MANLLFVSSSLFGDNSQSRSIASEFIDRWRATHPSTTVIERDLTADSMPHLSLATLAASMTPVDKRGATEREAAALPMPKCLATAVGPYRVSDDLPLRVALWHDPCRAIAGRADRSPGVGRHALWGRRVSVVDMF